LLNNLTSLYLSLTVHKLTFPVTMTLQEKLRNPTLGENRDDGGGVGHNRVVAVVLHLAAVDLEAAGENGVGNSAGWRL
jgi:hypothetical protein